MGGHTRQRQHRFSAVVVLVLLSTQCCSQGKSSQVVSITMAGIVSYVHKINGQIFTKSCSDCAIFYETEILL